MEVVAYRTIEPGEEIVVSCTFWLITSGFVLVSFCFADLRRRAGRDTSRVPETVPEGSLGLRMHMLALPGIRS